MYISLKFLFSLHHLLLLLAKLSNFFTNFTLPALFLRALLAIEEQIHFFNLIATFTLYAVLLQIVFVTKAKILFFNFIFLKVLLLEKLFI